MLSLRENLRELVDHNRKNWANDRSGILSTLGWMALAAVVISAFGTESWYQTNHVAPPPFDVIRDVAGLSWKVALGFVGIIGFLVGLAMLLASAQVQRAAGMVSTTCLRLSLPEWSAGIACTYAAFSGIDRRRPITWLSETDALWFALVALLFARWLRSLPSATAPAGVQPSSSGHAHQWVTSVAIGYEICSTCAAQKRT